MVVRVCVQCVWAGVRWDQIARSTSTSQGPPPCRVRRSSDAEAAFKEHPLITLSGTHLPSPISAPLPMAGRAQRYIGMLLVWICPHGVQCPRGRSTRLTSRCLEVYTMASLTAMGPHTHVETPRSVLLRPLELGQQCVLLQHGKKPCRPMWYSRRGGCHAQQRVRT